MTSSRRQKSDKPAPVLAGAYGLEFLIAAKKELQRLESSIQAQLLKKLRTRLASPKVQADKLRGLSNCFKIKLRASGVRLVYEVIDSRLVVLVIAVGRRDDSAAYEAAKAQAIKH